MAEQTMEDSDDDFERFSEISFSEGLSDSESTYSHDEAGELDVPNDTPATTPPSGSYQQDLPSDKQKKFECTYENCSKAFNRPARLEEHLRSHTNDRVFECQYPGCSNTYFRNGHLKHHVKSAHTKVRDYKCTWKGCNKSFTTGTRLRNHLAVHEGREQYRCRAFGDCNQTFRKKETLQRHIVAVHLGAKPFPCPADNCSKAFDTAEHLRQHQRVNHDPFRYSCTICLDAIETNQKLSDLGKQEFRASVYFSTWTDFQQHNRELHPPTCSICAMALPSNKALTAHQEVAHNILDPSTVNKPKIKCPKCNKEYTSKSNLRSHDESEHQNIRYKCGTTEDADSKTVQNNKETFTVLKQGSTLSGKQGEDTNKGTFVGCGAEFKRKDGLVRHLKAVHKGKEAGTCGDDARSTDLGNDNLMWMAAKANELRKKKRKHEESFEDAIMGTTAEDDGGHSDEESPGLTADHTMFGNDMFFPTTTTTNANPFDPATIDPRLLSLHDPRRPAA